jgi:hypothetical protein
VSRLLLSYGLMLAIAVGLFLLIRAHGETLHAPPPESVAQPTEPAEGKIDALAHVLLALAAVVATGRGLGKLFAYLGQPPVVGEVTAGILLGPSFLGWIIPGASTYLLPGPEGDLADAVCDDGADGPGDHGGDDADAVAPEPGGGPETTGGRSPGS